MIAPHPCRHCGTTIGLGRYFDGFDQRVTIVDQGGPHFDLCQPVRPPFKPTGTPVQASDNTATRLTAIESTIDRMRQAFKRLEKEKTK